MSVAFPSVEFFRALQEGLAANPSSTEGIPESEAYCGFWIDDQLFVLEFDGRVCSAVISGGNPLDLDFVLAGSKESWREAVESEPAVPLTELLGRNAIQIQAETSDGPELVRAGLPMLQAFLDQASDIDIAPHN